MERKIAEYGSMCINTGIAGFFPVGKIKGRIHILPHFNANAYGGRSHTDLVFLFLFALYTIIRIIQEYEISLWHRLLKDSSAYKYNSYLSQCSLLFFDLFYFFNYFFWIINRINCFNKF